MSLSLWKFSNIDFVASYLLSYHDRGWWYASFYSSSHLLETSTLRIPRCLCKTTFAWVDPRKQTPSCSEGSSFGLLGRWWIVKEMTILLVEAENFRREASSQSNADTIFFPMNSRIWNDLIRLHDEVQIVCYLQWNLSGIFTYWTIFPSNFRSYQLNDFKPSHFTARKPRASSEREIAISLNSHEGSVL